MVNVSVSRSRSFRELSDDLCFPKAATVYFREKFSLLNRGSTFKFNSHS